MECVVWDWCERMQWFLNTFRDQHDPHYRFDAAVVQGYIRSISSLFGYSLDSCGSPPVRPHLQSPPAPPAPSAPQATARPTRPPRPTRSARPASRPRPAPTSRPKEAPHVIMFLGSWPLMISTWSQTEVILDQGGRPAVQARLRLIRAAVPR